MKTILVFGLPGTGKTTFAAKLKELLGDKAIHFNGDEFRKTYNDWDFSEEGRRRQAERMRAAALNAWQVNRYAILDFVCPKQEYRDLINADLVVWMDRTPVRDFADTTAIFEEPTKFTWRIKDNADSSMIVELISEYLLENQFDENASTALMIGRYQPFHAGHKALFEKALQKHGQVCIAVRDMPRNDKNPLDALSVVENIHNALKEYRGKYVVVVLPNIVDVVYGRDVGWTVSKIDLPPEIEAISATKIRNNELDMSIEKQLQIIEKTAVQKQWNITFNGTKYDLDEHGQPMWNGGHGGEA
jgi:adenylylsulfate kinase